MESLESREYQPPERYEISSGEQKKVQYPDKVITQGVATCHAIGILNPKKGLGYLGHFYNWDTLGESLLNRAISEATTPADLEIAIAGNIPQSREDVASYRGDFQKVLEDYRQHGRWLSDLLNAKGIDPKNIKNVLIDNPTDDSYEMEVDTETGKITITKEEFEEDF